MKVKTQLLSLRGFVPYEENKHMRQKKKKVKYSKTSFRMVASDGQGQSVGWQGPRVISFQ